MTTIDCSRMSHESCSADAPEPASTEAGKPSAPRQAATEPAGASYDCMNECISSLGATTLVSGATVSLGCIMLPPACPVFIGTSVGTILGACQVACEDLESKP
jgi:hypothetical protein